MSRELLRVEIAEQPGVLARVMEREAGRAEALAREVRARDVELVVIAARGTSDHAAVYLRYLLEILAELPVSLAAPSVFTLYQGTPRLKRALVIGISQSGQGEDIRAVLAEGRRQGALTVALTNEPESPLAQEADRVLHCHAGREHGIPATKTYTAELMLAVLLAAELGGQGEMLKALASLPDDVEAVLGIEAEIAAAAESHGGMERCLVLGRGYNYATASEVALKLKEMAYVSAQPYAVPDFLHGPIVVVEEGYPLVLIAPTDRTLPNLRAAASAVRDKDGVVIALSDDAELRAMAHSSVAMPPVRHEALSPLPYAVAGQLLAFHLALAGGLDPSAAGGLRKVTSTR